MNIRLTISGRSYDVADSLPPAIELPQGSSLAEAIEHVAGLLPEGRTLPASCLVAVSGRHVGTLGRPAAHELRDGDELMIVAPVAGG